MYFKAMALDCRAEKENVAIFNSIDLQYIQKKLYRMDQIFVYPECESEILTVYNTSIESAEKN